MRILNGLVVAFRFLTRLYIPINVDWNKENLKRSLLFFSLVGGVIGSILYFISTIFKGKNEIVGASILLFIWLFLTGAMHLDGLSDMADGFLSNRDSKKTLEIMKDSRIGAFGTIAIVLILILKFEFLREIVKFPKIEIIFVPAIARMWAGYVLSNFETVKKEGLAYTFHSTKPQIFSWLGILLTTVVGFFVMDKILLLALLLLGFLSSNLIAVWAKKKIGGQNGDIYGAIVEIVETISLGVILWQI